jgi:carboxylesterase
MASEGILHNAHLDASPFFWEGSEDGVLLLHGFTATPVEVRSLGEALYQRGYTVAGPLLPGHATRPEDLNRTRWQEWVAVGEEAYRRLVLRCDRVYVGGESMGAVVALYLAAQHPEAAGVLAYAPAIQLAIGPLDRALLPVIAPFVPWRKKGGLDEKERWQGYQVDPLRGAVQLLHLARQTRRRLPEIEQPVLVVQGVLDTTVDRRVGQMILDGVRSPVTELRWMERSSHVVLLGPELEEVVEITVRFMEEAQR